MTENILEKLFEHNIWANRHLLQACSMLSDEQLDADPQSAALGSIRATLVHLAVGQQGYLTLLTEPGAERYDTDLSVEEMQQVLRTSGEGLLALVKDTDGERLAAQIRTNDGYLVAPWVILVQVIQHAGEHREQVCSMLSALGVIPPDLSGWGFGESEDALTPI